MEKLERIKLNKIYRISKYFRLVNTSRYYCDGIFKPKEIKFNDKTNKFYVEGELKFLASVDLTNLTRYYMEIFPNFPIDENSIGEFKEINSCKLRPLIKLWKYWVKKEPEQHCLYVYEEDI